MVTRTASRTQSTLKRSSITWSLASYFLTAATRGRTAESRCADAHWRAPWKARRRATEGVEKYSENTRKKRCSLPAAGDLLAILDQWRSGAHEPTFLLRDAR